MRRYHIENISSVYCQGAHIMFIASTKILECKGSISQSSFYGQLPNYQSHAFCLVYQVDEFSFKEMRCWGQHKISSYCISVWCESGQLGGRRSSKFPCITQCWKPSSLTTLSFVFGVNQENQEAGGIQDSQCQWWRDSLQTSQLQKVIGQSCIQNYVKHR